MNGEPKPVRPGAPRVLVSTLTPGPGGVDMMARFVVHALERHGCQPVIAHYAPYRADPALSVPTFRLLQRRPQQALRKSYDGKETHAIGAWLPELEFTHYLATGHWKHLMDSCDAFVSAAGNVLAATPFWQTGRPYLAWVATDWHGDRKDRIKDFPLPRRCLDAGINSPVIRRLEKKLLQSGKILSLSDYTAEMLAGITGPSFQKITLPVPVDTSFFTPRPSATVIGRIGFTGRYNDPRKNVRLLVSALAALRQKGHEVHAVLIGDTPSQEILHLVHRLGLQSQVEFVAAPDTQSLRDLLQTLDVFVLPSHQEGLCIAGLEAMACGVPVVSTRCGGPQEFVIAGRTGELAGFEPTDMADAIERIVADRPLRKRMAAAARAMVEERYTAQRAQETFWSSFVGVFPGVRSRALG